MSFSHVVFALLILTTLLRRGDFCIPPISENCKELYGDLEIRKVGKEQKDWSNLRSLFGRLQITASNASISLPNLENITGLPPLIVIRANSTQLHVPLLTGLHSLPALTNNSSDGEILIDILGWPRIHPTVLWKLQQVAKGALRYQGLTLADYVRKYSPPPADNYIEATFVLLFAIWFVPMAYLILKARYGVEINVLNRRAKDDLEMMKKVLLERRMAKFAHLNYYKRICGMEDLHKILYPSKAQATKYKTRAEVYEEWLEKELATDDLFQRLAEYVPAEIPLSAFEVQGKEDELGRELRENLEQTKFMNSWKNLRTRKEEGSKEKQPHLRKKASGNLKRIYIQSHHNSKSKRKEKEDEEPEPGPVRVRRKGRKR